MPLLTIGAFVSPIKSLRTQQTVGSNRFLQLSAHLTF